MKKNDLFKWEDEDPHKHEKDRQNKIKLEKVVSDMLDAAYKKENKYWALKKVLLVLWFLLEFSIWIIFWWAVTEPDSILGYLGLALAVGVFPLLTWRVVFQ